MSRFTARLSAADQGKPMMHMSVFPIFHSSNPAKTAELIAKGIRKTTQQLPYLTGRISRGKEQGYTEISWSEPHQEVVFERKDIAGLPSYAELKAKRMPLHTFTEDLRPSGAVGHGGFVDIDLPAFLASYTLLDEGVILSLSFHHHLVDAFGMAQLMAIIAGNTGGPSIGMNPDPRAILTRYDDVTKTLGLTKTLAPEGSLSLESQRQALEDREKQVAAFVSSIPQLINFIPKILTFGVPQLDALRDKLASEHGIKRPSVVFLISCLLWTTISGIRQSRQAAQAVQGGPEQPSTSTILLSMDSRSSFPFDSLFKSLNFIGNMSGVAAATQPVSTIAVSQTNDSTKYSALAEAIKSLTSSLATAQALETVKASYQAAFDTSDARKLIDGPFLPPNPVIVTSFANYPGFIDYGEGVGVPEFCRFYSRQGEGMDGACIILPRERARAGTEVIEVYIKLHQDDMAALEDHPLLKGLFERSPY